MVRSTVDGLTSVDSEADVAAATAMGYSPAQRFFRVELPLAGPVLLAGLRVVSVSHDLAHHGRRASSASTSLGLLFTDGFGRGISEEILAGIVMVLVLAFVLDGLLVLLGRLVMPWTRTNAVSRDRPAGSCKQRRSPRDHRTGLRVDVRPRELRRLQRHPPRLWEHVWITLLAVLIAAVIAVPVGYAIGHTRPCSWLRDRACPAASGRCRRSACCSLFGLLLGIGLQAPLARPRHPGDPVGARRCVLGHRVRRPGDRRRRAGPGHDRVADPVRRSRSRSGCRC